jgi:hypothetical protein
MGLLKRIWKWLNPDCPMCNDTGWMRPMTAYDPFCGPCVCCDKGKEENNGIT